MGYSTHIGSMSKREYNKIKSMSKEQLIEYHKLVIGEDENYPDFNIVYDFVKPLYEFGKNTDFTPPKKSLKTFFKNKELNKLFTEENDFNIVTKEFLEYIIDHYKQKISNYYNDIIAPFLHVQNSELLSSIKTDYTYSENNITFDFAKITQKEQNSLYKIIQHVRSMHTEWCYLIPYDLENGESITSSWKYEYAIFELIRIYKSFDWKRNVMIYYGG